MSGVASMSDVVGEYELGELSAVDEPDDLVSGGDCPGGSPGRVCEFGRRDKQAPGDSVRVEASGEVSYLRLIDGAGAAYGLEVEPFSAEGVAVDDAVNAAVSAAFEVVGVRP